ncbi:MAG: hypothetical protein V1811_01125 [Candidatus Micrarchaeota archaeon]
MARGQISLELFFVLSIFILVLLWLYNYSEVIKRTDASYAQLSFISSSLAATASKSCALGVSITWTPPCVYGFDLNTPKDYWGWLSASNTIDAYILDHHRTAKAACAFEPGSLGTDAAAPLHVICAGDDDPQTADFKYCISKVSDIGGGLPGFKITSGVCT